MAKKKTSGAFGSYFDTFSRIAAGFVEQKLKIKQRVEDIRDGLIDALYKFKAQIFRSTVELFLLITGIAAFIVGSIMYLSKYLSIDLLLIIYGVIVSFGVLLTSKLKREK